MGFQNIFKLSKFNKQNSSYDLLNIFCHFLGVKSTVRSSMEESLMQILRPKRRIDILRDVEEAAAKQRPYVITFCGVNGVGKSTNLAKVNGCGFFV